MTEDQVTDTREQLLALAERVEKATAEQQREMLWQSWQLAHGSTFAPTDADVVAYGCFVQKLDAEAYIDAAMTLVPEGLHLSQFGEARFMTRSPCFSATIEQWVDEHLEARTPFRCHGVAVTPALALTAAALRAKASQ